MEECPFIKEQKEKDNPWLGDVFINSKTGAKYSLVTLHKRKHGNDTIEIELLED